MEYLPEETSIFWKVNRLKTYEHWPFQSPDTCNPENMAAAGFVAIGSDGEPDLAECFVCGKQLDGWDPDDDPWNEHRKHQPSCFFVNLNKQDETMWTIADLFDLLKIYYVKESMREVEKAKAKVKELGIQLAKEIPNIYKDMRRSRKGVN